MGPDSGGKLDTPEGGRDEVSVLLGSGTGNCYTIGVLPSFLQSEKLKSVPAPWRCAQSVVQVKIGRSHR